MLRLSLVICKSLLEVSTALGQLRFPWTLCLCHVRVDLRFSAGFRSFESRHSFHIVRISLKYFLLLPIDWCFDLLLDLLALVLLIEVAVLRFKVSKHRQSPLLITLSAYQVPVQFVQLLSKVVMVQIVFYCEDKRLPTLLHVWCIKTLYWIDLALLRRIDSPFVDLTQEDARADWCLECRKVVVKPTAEVVLAHLGVDLNLKVLFLKFWRRPSKPVVPDHLIGHNSVSKS